jgi:transposase-like protein
MEKCKFCGCELVVKNGFVRNKQRYRCAECGKNQVAGDLRVKYDNATRHQALAMYLNSSGLRSIGRVLGVPFQSVSKWIANAGRIVEQEILKLRMNPRHVSILEMDELFTYVQKNSSRYEYGWLLIGTEMKLLRLTSGAGRGKMRGNSTGKSTATR